jgi:hypothetical protein
MIEIELFAINGQPITRTWLAPGVLNKFWKALGEDVSLLTRKQLKVVKIHNVLLLEQYFNYIFYCRCNLVLGCGSFTIADEEF